MSKLDFVKDDLAGAFAIAGETRHLPGLSSVGSLAEASDQALGA
jgi:hypothetical protein